MFSYNECVVEYKYTMTQVLLILRRHYHQASRPVALFDLCSCESGVAWQAWAGGDFRLRHREHASAILGRQAEGMHALHCRYGLDGCDCTHVFQTILQDVCDKF